MSKKMKDIWKYELEYISPTWEKYLKEDKITEGWEKIPQDGEKIKSRWAMKVDTNLKE